jgi:hypothetical protein
MVTLYDARTNTALGTLTEAQLEQLRAQLEEESTADQDYYISQDTLEMLEDAGVDAALLEMLKRVTAESGDADIRWG